MLAVLTLLSEFGFLAIFNTVPTSQLPDELVMVVIVIFTVSYFVTLCKCVKLQDVKVPLICGYMFRLVLLFWDIYGQQIYMLPSSGGDAHGFYVAAVSYAQGEDIWYGAPFTKIIGKIFTYVGISRFLGQFVVMLFSLVAIHMAFMVLDKLSIDTKTKTITMYILCLLPNYAMLSAIFLRESLIIMCMSISLYCFVMWYCEKNELFFAGAFIFVFCGAAFHAGVVGLAVGYIVVRMLYDGKQGKIKISARGILFSLIFLFIFIFLYNNYSSTLFGKVAGAKDIESIAQTSSGGGSDYAQYVGNSDNPINLVIYTPIRIAFFLFSPFPWAWRGLPDIIAFLFSSMFYMWTLIKAVKYLRNTNVPDKQLVIVLLILVICSVFVFAWGVANTGTAIRHRDKMVVLYLILYAVSTNNKQKIRN